MNVFSRPLTGLVLALLLALTGVQMAVARGAAQPAGTMDLCVGLGVVTVPVDADGNPVGPAHLCPDCVMSLIAVLPFESGLPAREMRFVALPVLPDVGVAPGRDGAVARARGPPVLI